MKHDIPYFVDSYSEAQNRFNADVDGKRGIASAIYPAQSTDLGNENFPYRQKIRGDGACYLNACLVGILNKCVGDEKKLQEFKANLNIKYPSTNDIINQIELRAKIDSDGTSQNGLDRKKLNQMLQDKENQNLGTQLAKEILISKHQELIDNYNKNKAKLEGVIKESESNKTKYTENYLDAFNEYIKTSDGLALLDKTPPTFDENYERNVKIMKDHFQTIHYHQNSKNDPDKNNPFKILRGLAGNPSEEEGDDKTGNFESITNKINNIKKEIANKEGYKNLILSVINNNNFATSYEEDMLFRIAEELTEGMGSNGGKLIIQSFVRLALEDTSFQEDYNIDRIYLINLDGNAHFDLMYNKGDPICDELESQDNQATQTREDKKINEQQERSKLITEIKELKKNSQNVSKDLINEILNDNKLEDVNLARLKLLKSIYEASTLAFEEIIKNEGPDQELFEAYFQAIKEGDQATQDENLHTNFPESVQELEDKIKTDIIIGKQLEIFNQLFEQNRVKKDEKQNFKEHFELGMDWWVFPGYTDNHDQDKFTATEEIYKLLARDQKYCQRYKTFIYQYMDSFDIDEEITHKIRFSKLVESLIGMTDNGKRTLAGFTQKEQDILFITVNNFYKEKGGEGLIYNENYTKHFQNLEKIATASTEIGRDDWINSAREKLRARLELDEGQTSSRIIKQRTGEPIFENDKILDPDQQDDFLKRSNPYSLSNKIGCGRLTDTIEGLEASYPFCHFRITHDPIAMRDNTSPIAKVKPIDKAEYLKHPPITAICIDYPDYRRVETLPSSEELKKTYKQKTLETLTLYNNLEVDHLVKHGDGMGVFLKQIDNNKKRENRDNGIISNAFKNYLDGFFEAITEFYDTNPQATLKKITFVTPDEVLERIFNEKLNEFKSNTSNSKILDSVEFKQDKAGPRFNSSKYYEQGAKKLGMTIAPNGDKKFLGGALNKGNVLEELITLLSDMASIGNPVFNPKVTKKLSIFKDQRSDYCTFFHQDKYDLPVIEFNTEKDSKFDYKKRLDKDKEFKSEEFTKDKEQAEILKLLRKAKDDTLAELNIREIDDNFFVAVMKVASKNSGIARINTDIFNKDLKEALKNLGSSTDSLDFKAEPNFHKIAKLFSANFQESSRQQDYLTAREGENDKINETGRRLFRVCTEENIQKFQLEINNSKQSTAPRVTSPSSILKTSKNPEEDDAKTKKVVTFCSAIEKERQDSGAKDNVRQ